MPCYCDSPDSENQQEIQSRCKTNMYFDACSLLTREQIKKSTEIGLSFTPGFSHGEINENLCKLCSIMTKEQMVQISAYYWNIKWDYHNLLGWYIQHMKDDGKNDVQECEDFYKDYMIKVSNEKNEIMDKVEIRIENAKKEGIERNLKKYYEAQERFLNKKEIK